MANPFLVQPAQYGPAMQQAAGAVDKFAQKQYMNNAKKAMASAFQSQDPMAIRDAVMKYPEIAETATQMFGFTNDQTEQVARETYRRALSETDPQRRAAIMEGGIETVSQFGGNPRMMSQDLRLLRENPEAFDRSAKAGYAAIASEQEFDALFPGGGVGGGEPARVRTIKFALENAGLEPGTPEYERALRVELGIEPRAGISADERIAQDPEKTTQVAQSKGEIAATEDASKQAIAESGKAREKLGVVRSSIPQYDRAIELVLEEGAQTGPIARRFPSITAAAVELDNIQSQLGLDVISSVTFGALSKGELDLALETALPQGLEGQELADWLRRKRDSQKKLADYLEEAAIFLGTPGNTPADWMKLQKSNREQASGSETVNWDDL